MTEDAENAHRWSRMKRVAEHVLAVSHLPWWVRQRGELRHHLNDTWRESSDFMAQSDALFRHWGYAPTDFADLMVVDIGAGSRLRSLFFTDGRVVAIEPLARQFMSRIPWCDLDHAEKVFARPAEQPVPELDEQAALVMCVNVLDHVSHPEVVLDNASRMLGSRGQLLLSVDMHDAADYMHPMSLSVAELRSALLARGLVILREYYGLPHAPAYGHGEAYTVVASPRAASRPAIKSATERLETLPHEAT
jgi:2-polyprenyl-3-methyl-5-hydroxy-6-metoxy-1,4-benzoquinol methylase